LIRAGERINTKIKRGFMRFIIFAAFVLLLGCSNQEPMPLKANAQSKGLVAFGTLSSADPIEAASSVVYTQLSRYRNDVSKLLRARKITRDRAIIARTTSLEIQKYLDAAVMQRNVLKIQSASKQIEQAFNNLGGE